MGAYMASCHIEGTIEGNRALVSARHPFVHSNVHLRSNFLTVDRGVFLARSITLYNLELDCRNSVADYSVTKIVTFFSTVRPW